MRNSTKKIDNNLNIDVASDTSSMIGVSPKISPRTAGFEIVTNIYKEIIECENEIELLREQMVQNEEFNGRHLFEIMNNFNKEKMIDSNGLKQFMD